MAGVVMRGSAMGGGRPGSGLLAAAPPAFAPGLEELAVAADACAPAALACALAHAIGRWLAAEMVAHRGVPEGRRRDIGPAGALAARAPAGGAPAMASSAAAGTTVLAGSGAAAPGAGAARLAETLAAGSKAGPSALAGFDMARTGPAALTGTAAAGAQAPVTMVAVAPGRACLLAAPRAWLAERGLPRPEALAALGLSPQRLLMVATRNGPEALWAAEEALRSGAAGLVIVAGCRPGFAATLRLDHAARAAAARVALLGVAGAGEAAGLSAARVRWRIAPVASRPDPWDARAPGRAAWTAEAVRRRDGPPGLWRMEWDDAAHAVRVAGRLADDGLAAGASAARRAA